MHLNNILGCSFFEISVLCFVHHDNEVEEIDEIVNRTKAVGAVEDFFYFQLQIFVSWIWVVSWIRDSFGLPLILDKTNCSSHENRDEFAGCGLVRDITAKNTRP